MEELDITSIHNRHKTRSLTDSRKSKGKNHINLLIDKEIEKPYEAICSDITYLRSGEGWLYLCTVKDIATGVVLGEATSERMKKELVIQAFLNAQARHNLPRGTIFHSDQGSQYTSKAFRKLLKLYGIKQSFSRIGKPGDNAWAESFFAILKKECIHFRHFPTRELLQQAVFAWIEGFYNTRRIQARLGYLTPCQYLEKLLVSETDRIA